jgi:hypothetical protein
MTKAPPEIAHFVAAIGEAATLRLIEAYAGTYLYVPLTKRGIASLGRTIGDEAAVAVAELLGNDRVRIPLAKGWRARHYKAQGMSKQAIALKLGCNDITVWKYLSAAEKEKQMALPLPAPESPQMALPLGPSREALTAPRARAEDARHTTELPR